MRRSLAVLPVHHPTLNQDFQLHVEASVAGYLREKYPEVRFLDREDDLGLPGLRKAKLSYYPHHLAEKCWAYRKEELDEDL